MNYKHNNKEGKQHVAGTGTECSQCEDQIAENAAAEQGEQIERRFSGWKQSIDFPYRGNRQYQKHPDRAQKEA